MKVLISLLLLFSISFTSCSKPCNSFENKFTNYFVAEKIIKSTSFKLKDEVNTSNSSWILSANYYSCDGKLGYLIIGTFKKDYIHKSVPIDIWEGFKNANSFGSYYNQFIKKRYHLIL